jgi:hypothetical protein|tara:strand:+ start:20 stop:784 length:765 start_codon:yes stop_codon:yes gene_type:complete
MKTMSDASEITFSNYGIYDLGDNLELLLPNTLIKFQRISDNAFSYFRENSEGQIIEKIIPVKSNDVKIELVPILPLNHPAKRTNYAFLKLDKEIHLGENSAASIFIQCPIEIGIFLIYGDSHEPLDWVTCNPLHSRFSLYGSPDTGTLCKYAEVSLATDYNDSISYVNGVMHIVIENTLSSAQTISKVIFPITENNLYYNDSKSILDGIKIIMKKRAAVNIAEVKPTLVDTEWTPAPAWDKSVESVHHMEMTLE